MDFSLIAAAAGLFTTFLGILTALVAEKVAKKAKLEKGKFEDLLSASQARAEEAKLTLLEALTERLPENPDVEKLTEALSSQLKIAGDVVINTVVKPEAQFIEELVNSYHQQALSQARVQFWFSVVAATVGFLYILYAATAFSADNWLTILKTLPGVVIDAVALMFFRQAEQTRERATELYDRLRSDSQAVMAKELLATINDDKVRSVAQAQIALHLSGVATKDLDVALLIEKP